MACSTDDPVTTLLSLSVTKPFSFDDLWKPLADKCTIILNWDEASKTIDGKPVTLKGIAQTTLDAYVLAYHLVSHPCNGLPAVPNINYHPKEASQIHVVNWALSSLLQSHLRDQIYTKFAAELAKPPSSELQIIRTYIRLWRSYLVSIMHLKTVFSCVASTRSAIGLDELPFELTEDLALRLWVEEVCSPALSDALRNEFQELVATGRKTNSETHVELAVELKDELAMLPSDIYTCVVEADYVKNMCAYFSERARELRQKDMATYAEVCLGDIKKELERSQKYLVSNEVAKVWLIKEIVDKNIDFFQSVDSASWMEHFNEATSDRRVNCVYELLLMSHQGRTLLETAYRSFFAQSLQKVVRRAPSAERMYMDIIQLFHQTFQSLKVAAPVGQEGSGGVEKAIETGLRWGFIDGTTSSVNYCILAVYVADRLSHTLSGVKQADEAVKGAVEEAVHLYSFLPDVDPSAREAFLGAHRAHLARRLLHGCYNEELEKRTLDLLGVIQLSPTLFRCRSMIQSASCSTIYINDAATRTAVLPKSAWPLTDSCAEVALPPALDAAVAEAKAVCQKANKGQIVELSRWYSFGVVRLRLAAGSAVPHVDLEVSLPQLAVLQCFNRQPTWPFVALCEEVQITPAEGKVVLAPLVTSGLLVCQPWPPQKRSVLERNPAFAPATATPLHLVPQAVPRALGEREELSVPVAETERISRLALEGGTLQLLKRHGPQSVADIAAHLNSLPHNAERAAVSEKMVKRCLEMLIQRGFVQRNEEKKFEFRLS